MRPTELSLIQYWLHKWGYWLGARRNHLWVLMVWESQICFHAMCGIHWLRMWWLSRWVMWWGGNLRRGRRIPSRLRAGKKSRATEHSLFQHPTRVWKCCLWGGPLSLISTDRVVHKHWCPLEVETGLTVAVFSKVSWGAIHCHRGVCWMYQRLIRQGGVANGEVKLRRWSSPALSFLMSAHHNLRPRQQVVWCCSGWKTRTGGGVTENCVRDSWAEYFVLLINKAANESVYSAV